ncbi:uncharacterized protein KQ657_001936 [Scheffersomyces spartinae]|uniref:Uncharacterized protein n=1 Tax=Scheffersomyces spartinae TaxID=45513 RepID=A0A9P7V6D8_9ASCO|nr:uncharacterized protein KQ657_001936 [Scheffersomyces spartinae]KAG7192218.1 hypothetical protein KQ657_001936 [Scheffersomyces spartinae]
MSEGEYTAVHGLMQLMRYQNNYPNLMSGVDKLSAQAKNLFGPNPPPVLIDYALQYQMNLFGDYPTSKDVVPSAIFSAVFGIIAIIHLGIFSINYSRGHYFWLSLGWAFYAIMRTIGWILRIVWSKDLTRTGLGIADEVLLLIPAVLLIAFNLILAQRIFTWRHPVGGSRKLFWAFMMILYVLVIGVIAMCIVGSAVPYLYFLSTAAVSRYQKVVEAAMILLCLYSLTAVSLLGLAYFLKPTRRDESLYTYQPWWIESFAPTYFVRKGAEKEAAVSFLKRNRNQRNAIRVIAATHHHYKQVHGVTNERGALGHNVSLGIVSISTVLILIGCILRTVVVFEKRYQMNSGPATKPVAMYIAWGLFEFIINAMYIIGRVDLRFYRPNKLPNNVRDINTADQTHVIPSDDELEVGDSESSEKPGPSSSSLEQHANDVTPPEADLIDNTEDKKKSENVENEK